MKFLVNGAVSGGGFLRWPADPRRVLAAAAKAADLVPPKPPPAPPARRMRFGAPRWVDVNDTRAAGWRLVVAAGADGDAIAKALEPLVVHRAGDGSAAADAVLRLPADVAGGGAVKLREWAEQGGLRPAGLSARPPQYVLLAGSPATLPFELQHLLAAKHGTGRLSFADVGDYAAYADKVIRWEPADDAAATPRDGLPAAFFGTDHGRDDVTRLSREHLVDPYCAELGKSGRPVASAVGAGATREALLGLLRDGPVQSGPRLFFSATHGLAVPGEDAAARAARAQRQGALVCRDWPLLGDAEAVGAGDLPAEPLLPGGIAVLFACFGAGTPTKSDFFTKMFDDPGLLGFHDGGPFVAALPTRLLASPDGPLAVLGHLDPSFLTAFSTPGGEGGERNRALYSVIEALLKGVRLGASLEELTGDVSEQGEALRQLGAELQLDDPAKLTALLDAPADTPAHDAREAFVDTAVSVYDFRNFVVLGDPAVKLPRAGAKPAGRANAGATGGAPAVGTAAVTGATAAAPGAGTAAVTGATATGPAAAAAGLPEPVLQAAERGALVRATADALFSAAGVPLDGGEPVVVLAAVPCDDVRVRPAPEEPADGARKRRRYFEAAEHQDCDRDARLRLSTTEVYEAPAFRLPLANGLSLRYGEIISLAGDFFGIPDHPVDGDAQRFLAAFATIETPGARDEVAGILAVMQDERKAVEDDQAAGGDGVAAYERLGNELNARYNRATGGGCLLLDLLPRGRFLKLAGQNYDHFGDDALAAYRAGHGCALQAAAAAAGEAAPAARRAGLLRAYAMNAFSDHFLTDLFASGHLRVPRHALAAQVKLKLVGDLLAKRMHDEDNTAGLNVRNARGDAWVAYGDQHFNAAEHAQGRALVRAAVAASAAEVWTAFEQRAGAASLGALRWVPDLADARDRADNAAPMFKVDAAGRLVVRKRPKDPTCREWTPDFTGVAVLLRT